MGTDPAPPALSEGPGDEAREAARAGLYVHVPFCRARCPYCDFASGLVSAGGVATWLDGIERESALRAPEAAGVVFGSLFLGGGTPSTLDPDAIGRCFRALRGSFAIAPDAEITLEANPESVTASRVVAWTEAGVDRLSVGAQSFAAAELVTLGRVHGSEDPGRAFALARAHGIRRLSLDLIFGFPGHTLTGWAATLERAFGLEPEHVSAYAFIPEPGTPLGDAVLSGRTPRMEDAEQADAYEMFLDRAARAGLACYETSNVCRPGAEARHNLVYWLRRPYAGVGPSAHGLLRGERYANERDLARWAAALAEGRAPEAAREPAAAAARAREIVMLGLRLAGGLRVADYAPEVWSEVERRYGRALDEAVAAGRLGAVAGGFAVPRALRFVADDVLAWIEARAEAHAVDSRSAHSVPSDPCPIPPSSATGAAPIRT